MVNLSQFERLAQTAREERAPRIDVSGRVAATVLSLKRRQVDCRSTFADSPLLAFAGFSLAAAALVGMLALPCWESMQDPLVAFCRPLSEIFE